MASDVQVASKIVQVAIDGTKGLPGEQVAIPSSDPRLPRLPSCDIHAKAIVDAVVVGKFPMWPEPFR